MKRHPSKQELFAHAESLVARGPISARIAGHVATCRACQTQVEGIRASLSFAAEAPELEPAPDFMAQLLMAVQTERRTATARRSRLSMAVSAVKIGAYAAAILLVGAVSFSAALVKEASAPNAPFLDKRTAVTAASSHDTTLKIATDIQALAAAVAQPSKKKPSLWEVEHRRTVHALNADIEAARAALERNPGCDRATRMMDRNLQRQAQVLKALYVEKAL